MQDGRWITRPCDWARVEALAGELGVSETTATVLVRRGLDNPAEARAFLEADDPRHDPLSLGDMAAAVDRIRAAIAAGQRICVHGDYDVDGISATAVCVLVLRELGATVDWRLPSRFDEGYGLALETIEQLAADGVDLVVTVDCGITAVSEVARARELGVDVIVTDHHRPGEALPDCLVVATRPSDYPCADLCGTGVVHTLARALLGDDHPRLASMLDLVALATIADVVPL
ncbi:MAG TPA: DHH family phosphoesterase, partial [Gaiella sp.]